MALLPELLIPMFTVVAAFLLIGLSHSSTAQHGSSGIAGWLDWLASGGPFAALFGLASKATRYVVSHFAAAQLKLLTRWIHGMNALQRTRYKQDADFAVATADALAGIQQEIKGETGVLNRANARTRRELGKQIAATKAEAKAVSRDLTRFKTKVQPQIRAADHAIAVTIPAEVAGLRARNKALEDAQQKQGAIIDSLEHGASDVWDWVRSHPLSTVTAAFGAAVLVALSRLGFGFLRCRSWQNVAKQLTCGLGSSLLNLLDDGLGALIGVFLTYETIVHLRDIVKLGQSVEGGVASGIQDLLNVK